MKKQRYPASAIKVGAVLYQVLSYETEGRIRIKVDEWVVRSIQKKRGTQSQRGMAILDSFVDNTPYVNITARIKDLTWAKLSNRNGDYGWKRSIPKMFQKQFRVGDDLPLGVYTTRLAALKYHLYDTQQLIKVCESALKEDLDGEDRVEWEEELELEKRVAAALKSRITKSGGIKRH